MENLDMEFDCSRGKFKKKFTKI